MVYTRYISIPEKKEKIFYLQRQRMSWPMTTLLFFFFFLIGERKRLMYMKSVNAVKGGTRIVDRNNVYEDVIDMYRCGDIVGECPIHIKFSSEEGLDYGGVQRDMFSAFWEQAYSEFFEGATLLIPMVNPHMKMSIYPILGRIISHGYLVAGHLPVRIALPTLINMLLGPKTVSCQILLETFLDYISAHERAVFKEALTYDIDGKFSSTIQETLLSVLSRFGCRQLPSPYNLKSCIEHIAQYEFITRPAAAVFAVYSGIPLTHQGFWMQQSVQSMSMIYQKLTVTAEKVRGMLVLPQAQSPNEERVYGYLTTMIGNMNTNELRSFLRFVTGSTVCSSNDILVTFNILSGLSRRPIAHTCDSTLELSSTYINFDEFYEDFKVIFDKVNEEFSFRMDAL